MNFKYPKLNVVLETRTCNKLSTIFYVSSILLESAEVQSESMKAMIVGWNRMIKDDKDQKARTGWNACFLYFLNSKSSLVISSDHLLFLFIFNLVSLWLFMFFFCCSSSSLPKHYEENINMRHAVKSIEKLKIKISSE